MKRPLLIALYYYLFCLFTCNCELHCSYNLFIVFNKEERGWEWFGQYLWKLHHLGTPPPRSSGIISTWAPGHFRPRMRNTKRCLCQLSLQNLITRWRLCTIKHWRRKRRSWTGTNKNCKCNKIKIKSVIA